MLLLLRCNNCGKEQKMLPRSMDDYQTKRKTCVYCGKSFGVKDHIVKKLDT